jgi:hypothetical protein
MSIRACLVALTLGLATTAQASATASSYVVLGEDGVRVARLVTPAATCPAIRVDGAAATPMSERVAPATLALRPTISKPEYTKASEFPVRVCEAVLKPTAKSASIDGVALPVPPARIDRIVVIGDTGCRLKASENLAQACNDPAAYPFARIARRAADWKPQLVIHVGDYLYRETPCPEGNAACAGSPWGYGWDAWKADFFEPAAPLLQAAAWVVVRGNHEGCMRGGQGWFRLLDPRTLDPGRDCNDPARDFDTDYSAPYAAPLGGDAQVIVLDMASAGEKPLAADTPKAAQFRQSYDRMAALAGKSTFNIVANHKPLLGFGAEGQGADVKLRPGNQGAQSVFLGQNPNLFPDSVKVLLAGHIHIWEQVSFASPHPSQFITGFSGTLEDVPNVAPTLPTGASPAPGAVPDHFSVWSGQFGYMTLERLGGDRWSATVHDVDGKIVRRCQIVGSKSAC